MLASLAVFSSISPTSLFCSLEYRLSTCCFFFFFFLFDKVQELQIYYKQWLVTRVCLVVLYVYIYRHWKKYL